MPVCEKCTSSFSEGQECPKCSAKENSGKTSVRGAMPQPPPPIPEKPPEKFEPHVSEGSAFDRMMNLAESTDSDSEEKDKQPPKKSGEDSPPPIKPALGEMAKKSGIQPASRSSDPPKPRTSGKLSHEFKKFQIQIHDGDRLVKIPLNEGENIVGIPAPEQGHHPKVDLSPMDPNRHISRKHAAITIVNGRIFVKDLGSRNGTEVRMQLVGKEPVEVDPGELIVFARIRCKIVGLKTLD